ncbi:C-GCAxxG-C-C family protein [Parasporobacterium paucivorans]|uniref:Putative redox-active protein (C_GCAxxG_C_C) n=1 Tax=Parasporobacterium paucivorans DSM 15970 TaxID=1122934 RepID=A0A1M6HUD3_9FIRM|nr:C-GCAxxG-C-C family protein [Parasporobacterium paucivorans]SHJ25770.1 Putative redox-active protein (C_GCAxxG_C_C) [Parasporobacterium paucivorans DSM 15970]
MNLDERVMELALQNQCCAQVVMRIGLELSGKENPDMIKAVKGLCYGVSGQHLCGALSAAACVLSLYESEEFIPELADWFEEEYGSVECRDLMGVGGKNPQLCIKITTGVIDRCMEIIEERDRLPER